MKRYIQGFIIFPVAVLLLGYVGFPLQAALGVWGLVLTELITLGVALAAVGLCRFSIKETFPLRRITGRQWGGFALLYVAGQSIAAFLTALTTLLTPEVGQRLEEVGQITRTPLYIAIPVVAILPAICEEALFRGVLRRCFAGLSPMTVSLAVGLMFGAFHLDIYRLVPTAVLGVAITYLCVKTDNFALAVLYHFVNNLWSVLGNYLPGVALGLPGLAVAAVAGVGCWILASRILTKR